MTYRVLTHSRRIEKDFLRIITGFSEDEQNTIWQILRLTPKGAGEPTGQLKRCIGISGNLTCLPAIAWNIRL